MTRIISAVLLALLIGCADQEPASESVLRRGLSAEAATLDPQQARSVAELKVLGDLYEGLLTLDAAGQRVAGAAETWIVSPDQRTYTFTLRENARWQDGAPVTAEDFVQGWQALIDPATAAFYADLLMPVEGARAIADGSASSESLGIRALDERTLSVTLARPQSDFLHRTTHPALAPRRGDQAAPFANGAYRLAERRSGRIELVRNDDFHARDTVRIEQVSYEVFEQEATEYVAFRAGELDVTSRVPREVFLETDADRPDTLKTAPYLGTVYLAFNMRRPPPLALRRQLSAAIDRDVLATRILGRGELPAQSMVPPGTANGEALYTPRPVVTGTEEAAVTPASLTLSYASSDENRIVAAALQDMWRSALPEVELELQNREFRVLLAEMRGGEFDGMVRASWIADYNDAAQFLSIFTSDHPANNPGFADTRFDALIEAARATDDPEQRERTLHAAEQILATQVPVIPLYHFVSKHMVANRVQGWRDNVLDLHYSRYLDIAADTETE